MIKEVKSLKDYFDFFSGLSTEVRQNANVAIFLKSYKVLNVGCACKRKSRMKACVFYQEKALKEVLLKFNENIVDFYRNLGYIKIEFYHKNILFKSIEINEQ